MKFLFKKNNNKIFIVFILIVTILSCNKKNYTTDESSDTNIVATIDDYKIEYQDVDLRVIQELYDQLYKIYRIRKIALKKTIDDKVIEIEANKHNLSIDEYVDKSLKELKGKINFESFSEEYFKETPLIRLERGISYYDIKSEKGQELAKNSYNNYLKDLLIDSLKMLHKINILLEPPLPPKIDFDRLNIETRGNLNSKVSVFVIADLECTKCNEYNLIYEKLFELYHEKVKFGFVHYASYPSVSIIATMSAANQNKFWEMKDSLMNLPELPDTLTIYRIANNIGLDFEKFKTDFNNKSLKSKIEKDFEIINRYGIYAVPTVLVNSRLVYDPSSQEEIENLIIKELKSI